MKNFCIIVFMSLLLVMFIYSPLIFGWNDLSKLNNAKNNNTGVYLIENSNVRLAFRSPHQVILTNQISKYFYDEADFQLVTTSCGYATCGYATFQNDLSQSPFSLSNKVLLDEEASYKSPWLAFGLSLLYPGLGQLYNAEYGKALLMAGLGTAGLGLTMAAVASTNFDSESNPSYIGVMLYSGLTIWGISYFWSIIDAPISASNINERNKNFGMLIYSYFDKKLTLRLGSGRTVDSNSLGFSVNFVHNF